MLGARGDTRRGLHVPGRYFCPVLTKSGQDKFKVQITNKKLKVFLVHPMKAYRGNRGIAPLILNFDTKWEWLNSYPGRITPGK